MYAHAQAPVRIGIAGGGTDLPAWTRERVGRCLTLAINHYTHAVAIVRPDRQVVASYRHLDTASAATEIANGLIRESALMHDWEDGFEVHTMSEISSQGSGLGVSSSIAVCLAAMFQIMSRIAGRTADLRPASVVPKYFDGGEDAFRQRVARDAWTVEIDRLRRPVGRQDHMAAAWGGLRLYRFEGSEATVERTFSEDDAKWLASHLVLVRLPEGHDSRVILSNATKTAQMQLSADALVLALRALETRDVGLLGEALSLCQRGKQQIAGAVTTSVDDVVRRVLHIEGVRGCKVTGAGGGGHVVAACDNDVTNEIREATQLAVHGVIPNFSGVRINGWKD